MTLLEAISPTARALLTDMEFFVVNYTWTDATLGELSGSTVVPACDGRAACEHLQSRHPHLTRVWLAAGETNHGDTETRR